MSPHLTVAICTYNPRRDYLSRVMTALQRQTLPLADWDLLIIDNASAPPVADWLDISWHPRGRIVVEPHQGLTPARLRAYREAQTEILAFVDDDNVLAADYLQQGLSILNKFPKLGAIGGKCLPEFEQPPAEWFQDVGIPLGLRDFGDESKIHFWANQATQANSDRQYPAWAPIGAGLMVNKVALATYCENLDKDPRRLALDRTGNSLTSGGDNDLIMTLLEQGWAVGYFPQLSLLHLIAAGRLNPDYLRRMNRDSCRSWVQVLDLHGLRPWPKIPAWTVPLRQLKSYLQLRPWTSTAAAIRWQGACGLLEGQARLL
jgi:glycosyltransferase involved in cell wall biosynthesis